MCCAPGPVVELEVLVDLALALALGRLVDRELDLALAVRHHLRHQRGVLGRDVVVAEVDHLGHPEDALVELDPLVHLAELDVADDVVEREQADTVAVSRRRFLRDVARQVRAFVVPTGDERVHDVAVGRDRRELDAAELVLVHGRLGDTTRTARDCLVVGLARVRDAQRDVLDAVAVLVGVIGDLAARMQRARDDERGSRSARARSLRDRARRSPGLRTPCAGTRRPARSSRQPASRCRPTARRGPIRRAA